MSNPVSFVQWITHSFPNFASLKFNALFFPFLGHSLDLMGKMKQHIQRPIWMPCNPVDLSSISKQKLCFLKKNPCLRSFFLKQLSDENCTMYLWSFHLSILRTSSPSIQTRGAQNTMTFPFPTDMAHIPLHPHTCYSLS